MENKYTGDVDEEAMYDDVKNIEKEAQESPRKVVTEEGFIALEYNKPGDRVKLSGMFPPKAPSKDEPLPELSEPNPKRITKIYFSTGSENIYLFTPDAIITNGNKSQARGVLQKKQLNSEILSLLYMEVGNRFPYILGFQTTDIKSILVVTNEKYSSDEMGEVPKTDIEKNFKKKIEGVSTPTSGYNQSLDKKAENVLVREVI